MVLQLVPPLPRPPATAPSAAGTHLAPADPFPSLLAELDLVELQVLHSRVCRRLEQEYLTDPDGPHPVTLDRCQELAAELDVRESFLSPPVAVPGPTPGRGPDVEDRPEPPPRSATGTTGALIQDLREVRPGDPIEVWQQGRRHCRGTVEEACPALGVVWIHEAGDGYRRMVHVQDTELRQLLPPEGS